MVLMVGHFHLDIHYHRVKLLVTPFVLSIKSRETSARAERVRKGHNIWELLDEFEMKKKYELDIVADGTSL